MTPWYETTEGRAEIIRKVRNSALEEAASEVEALASVYEYGESAAVKDAAAAIRALIDQKPPEAG